MSVSPVSASSQIIRTEVQSSYSSLLDCAPAFRNHVDDLIRAWELETNTVLAKDTPFSSQERSFLQWKERLEKPPISEVELSKATDHYVAFCKETGHPANESFWRNQFKSSSPEITTATKVADDIAISARLLSTEWQKRLDQARSEWELRKIAARRAALMSEISRLLNLLQTLHDRLSDLGLDTGILLDFSRGNLTAQDIQQFERWAKYLAEDKGIRALCELLGRVRQIELSETIERVTSIAPVKATLPDISSREEIVGIRLGRDIENLLPAELALLADPDTSILFDLKFFESRLMCFDMQGIQRIHRHEETEGERSVKRAEKQGPMVICIDTSGSMNGMPETVAKAVALYLAAKASAHNRPCYLITFSTSIFTLDLSAKTGMEALLNFLKMSFHGGTDVAPAIEHALDTMEQDAYKNADLLVVSDFIMSGLADGLLTRIKKQRFAGNRFHSLVVGDCYMTQRLRDIFDNEWVFEPSSSQIHEIIRFERDLNVQASANH